jgi:hypothetical protein
MKSKIARGAGVASLCFAMSCGGKEAKDDSNGDNAGGAATNNGAGGRTPSNGGASSTTLTEVGSPPNKMDLVLVVDNSIGMGDKQELLVQAVPLLLRRLTTPLCRDSSGRPAPHVSGNGECPSGSFAEFPPIADIHIAVVTSSLGAHGGQICDVARANADPSEDDRGYPLGLVRPELEGMDWDGTGFLAWDPGAATGQARNDPPGVSNLNTLESQLENMVRAVGEVGCGYEATLEAWYRFLIDPEPPSHITTYLDSVGNPLETSRGPVDQTLLGLRARFLRPDSLVGIIMLTDENDCSILDEGQSFLVGLQTFAGKTFAFPRVSSKCDADPNDECCYSCAAVVPQGCERDPICEGTPELDPADDNLNLRCYDQKRRFGIDLLHPISRYIDGLTNPFIRVSENNGTINPLFRGGQRNPSMIYLTGIVGVPWQDLSTTESWAPNAPLQYLRVQIPS